MVRMVLNTFFLKDFQLIFKGGYLLLVFMKNMANPLGINECKAFNF